MADPTPQPVKTEAKSESKGVTLYNSDGRKKTVTDPSVVVDLEYNGWSQNKDAFKKTKK